VGWNPCRASQAAHHAINDQLGGLDLPAITALNADLVEAVEEMIDSARHDGAIRTDLDPAIVTALITETAHAIARAKPPCQNLADAYLSVLLDGLRPAPDRRPALPSTAPCLRTCSFRTCS
jgi:hypothetical protein